MVFKSGLLALFGALLISSISHAQEPELPAGARLVGQHVVFENYKSAADWLRPNSLRQRQQFGAEKFEVLDEGGSQTAMQSYVDELWEGFKQVFPEATKGLPAPILILVESDSSNAYVDRVKKESSNVAHAVIATTQLITDAGGIEAKLALTGILAHEMAHSVFLSAVKEKAEPVTHYLKFQKDTPDFRAPRDAGLQSRMEEYFEVMKYSGDLSYPEFHSLPSHAVMEPAYLTVFFQRILQQIMRPRRACFKINDLGARRDRLVSISSLNFRVEIAPKDLPALDKLSGELVQAVKECAGDYRLEFGPAFANLANKPLEELRLKDSFRKMETLFDGAPDVISGLQAVVEADHQLMREVEKEIDVTQVGSYTVEQFADDVSAIVHAQLGRDARAYSQLLDFYMEQTEAGSREACRQISQDGARPPLGSFKSDHHTYCYRIYNLETMKRALEKASSIKEFAKEFVMRTTRENP